MMMPAHSHRFVTLALLASACLALPAAAASSRIEAPFFILSGVGQVPEDLALLETRYEANVVGPLAELRIVQRYANRGTTMMETVYVVPASEDYAVHGFQARIGTRVLRAEIAEKSEARREFVRARKEGKRASLLEQYGDTAFRMSVTNIRPGEEVEIELRASQLVPVVGAEQVLSFAPPVPTRSDDPTRKAPDKPEVGAVAIEIMLEAGTPVGAIDSPTHMIAIDRTVPGSVRVTALARRGEGSGFELRYGLRGAAPAAGVVTWQGKDSRYFLIGLQPPATVEPVALMPREYIFVVDATTSMYGAGLESVRYIMARLLAPLRPQDRFNVVSFAKKVRVFRKAPVAADPETVREAIEKVETSEESFDYRWWREHELPLVPALARALAMPLTPGAARTVVLVTDGQFKLDQALFDALDQTLGDEELAVLGAGSWSEANLKVLAANSNVGTLVTVGLTTADEDARRFAAQVAAPVATDLTLTGKGVLLSELAPKRLPDLQAERPLWLVGKLDGDAGELVLRGRTAAGPYEQRFAVPTSADRADAAAIERLWVRRRIGGLLDRITLEEKPEWRREVTSLALAHSMATPYTSFIAIDEEPLPKPEESEKPAEPPKEGEMLVAAPGPIGFAPVPVALRLLESLEPSLDAAPRAAPAGMARRRDLVVVMDAKDPADPFMVAARAFYAGRDALVERGVGSIAELAEVLARHAAQSGAPLGQVRIVAHGTEWTGISVPLVAGGEDTTPEAVAAALRARPFAPLDDGVLDATTRIVIESCGLGRRPALLEQLARLLGGDDEQRPRVEASRGLVSFAEAVRIELDYEARIVPLAAYEGAETAGSVRNYPLKIMVTPPAPEELERVGLRRWLSTQSALRERLALLGVTLRDLSWRRERDAVVGEARILLTPR